MTSEYRMIESLEARRLLSAQMVGTKLVITGTAGNDSLFIPWNGGDQVTVDENGVRTDIDFTGGTGIVINAGNGNDSIAVSPDIAVPVAINAGNGDDDITAWYPSSNQTFSFGGGLDHLTIIGLQSVRNPVPTWNYTMPGDLEWLSASRVFANVTGNASNNIIDIQNGTVNGLAGNDVISASFNATIQGGSGDDRINGGRVVDGGAGYDRITNFFSPVPTTLNGGDGNDYIRVEGTSSTINGGAGNDIIYGGSASDLIDAGLGYDTINGGEGPDTINGNQGTDVAQTDPSDQFSGVEVKIANVTTGPQAPVFSGVITTTFSNGVLAIRGSSRNDRILVGLAADGLALTVQGSPVTYVNVTKISIVSGVGDDYIQIDKAITAASEINAGAGNDTIRTGQASDTVVGGTGTDEVSYADRTAAIKGQINFDFLSFQPESETRPVMEKFNGTAGQSGESDILTGIEILNGGAGNDTLSATTSSGGLLSIGDFEQTDATAKAGVLSTDFLTRQPLVLQGGGGNDVFWSKSRVSAVNFAATPAGRILMDGAEGEDEFRVSVDGLSDVSPCGYAVGGAGNDLFREERGEYSQFGGLDGGLGTDTWNADESALGDSAYRVPPGVEVSNIGAGDWSPVTVFGSARGDIINLTRPAPSLIYGYGGNDTISCFASDPPNYDDTYSNNTIYGGDGNDFLRGGDGYDVIYGEGGVDRIEGNAGNDTISGGDAGDRLYGGTGNDVITGAAGNDTLYGNDGDDDLDGGAGADYLDGGLGADRAKTDALDTRIAIEVLY